MKKAFLIVDSKNRICLSKISKKLPIRFCAYKEKGKIILEPVNEKLHDESWIFKPENKKFLKEVKEGLKQIKSKKLISRGSFAKYR